MQTDIRREDDDRYATRSDSQDQPHDHFFLTKYVSDLLVGLSQHDATQTYPPPLSPPYTRLTRLETIVHVDQRLHQAQYRPLLHGVGTRPAIPTLWLDSNDWGDRALGRDLLSGSAIPMHTAQQGLASGHGRDVRQQ